MITLLDELEAHKNNPKDKRTFGLVLAGGAMRGAYGAGAMVPLITHRLVDAFEHVVGASAGAINGTYFVDEYANTMSAYIHDLTTKQFVNLLRLDKKVDVDYAIERVMKGKHPFDTDQLSHAKAHLHILLTDAKTGKKVVLSDHHKFEEIYQELRASAALPILYNNEVLLGDRYYIDGAVADALPIDVALKLKCTDIVVILNQQLKSYHFDKRHKRLERHLVRVFAKDKPKVIQEILPTNEKLLQLNIRRLTSPHKKVRVYVLEPSDEEVLVSLGSIDKQKIEQLARLGVTDMEFMLNKPIQKA